MARNNATKAYMVSWIALAFGITLLFLDFFRYQKGYMDFGKQDYMIYRLQIVCHLILLSIVIPVYFLNKNMPAIMRNDYKYLDNNLVWVIILTGLALVPAGIMSVKARGSIVGFATYIIFVNHFFYFNGIRKVIINLICFLSLILGISFLRQSSTLQLVYFIEGAGIIIPSFLISNIQMRMKYENFINNKKLEQKNKMMQTLNQTLMVRSLQGQMNPHFIFNTLNSIQHFMITKDQKSSIEYLSKFAKLIRLIFNYSAKNLISLENEIEFLKLYLNLEKLRFENKIQINFQVDRELESKSHEIFIPPLLIQPLIENAFKHGLMHLESEGRLNIHFSTKNNLLICTIQDNGVGREKAAQYSDHLRPTFKNGVKKASALDIIQERLDVFNEMLSPDTEPLNQYQIDDLVDMTGNVTGTIVQVSLVITSDTEIDKIIAADRPLGI